MHESRKDAGGKSLQPGPITGAGSPTERFACGKTILVGEHAVVYGTRALAMPVPTMRMRITVSTATGAASSAVPSAKSERPVIQMFLSGNRVSDHLLAAAHQAVELLKLPLVPLRIEGDSSLWIGAGLGSSASLCVGLLRSLSAHFGLHIQPRDLAVMANVLEGRFHGRPSGLDAAVVALETVICFAKATGPEPLDLPVIRNSDGDRRLHFAIIDSRTRASTRQMVEIAAPYFAGAAGERRLSRFDQLAGDMMKALPERAVETVGAIMTEANVLLTEAGVVPPALADIMTLAREAGCESAKITGAGGGGSILALLSTKRPAAEQLARLEAALGRGRVLGMTL